MAIGASAIAAELLSWRLASFGIHDEAVFALKLIGYLYGRTEETAYVAAKVDNQILEILL